ncbi:MAG: acylphosphatase [Kiloniellales bacterium]
MKEIARHVLLSGRVQGVWFRGWTCQEAESLGLTGWVRNRRDGRVEALLIGTEQAVQDMLRRLRRGPPMAQVTHVESREADPRPLAGFEQRPSA